MLTTDVGTPGANKPQLALVGQRPGRGEVKLRVELPEAMEVQLTVFDVLGRRVNVLASGMLRAGVSELAWNGKREDGGRAVGGVYFLKLEAAGVRRTARVVLLQP